MALKPNLAKRRQNPSPPEEPSPSPSDQVGEFLRVGLKAGLESFHPQIDVRRSEDMETLDDFLIAEVSPADGPPPFYAIACLELYNHIAEKAVYLRCANCGDLFVRQQGRAHQQQHRRRGVLYCTHTCATTAAKRAQRQRAKARKATR